MITHPEKVLFPDDGITKGDLAAYYEAMAPVMLPHLRGRPITMERYPAGIGKKGFWQKDVSKGFPAWLKRVEVPKKDGVVHHPDRHGHAIVALDHQPKHHHAARLDLTDPRPVLPGYLRVRSRSVGRMIQQLCAPPRSVCAICSTSSRCRRGSRHQARRASISSFPSTARPKWPGRALCECCGQGVRESRPRSTYTGVQQGRSPRAAFMSIPEETATAPRLRRRIPCARSAARRSPRRAHGTRSRVAKSILARSRCGTCPIVSRRLATSGPICGGAGDR